MEQGAYINILLKHLNNKYILSKKDISSFLDVSISSVNNMMNQDKDKLKHIKFGSGKQGGVKFNINDFAEYLENKRIGNNYDDSKR